MCAHFNISPPRFPHIGFCIDNLHVGGTELNALRTTRSLTARGINVTLFSLNADGPLRADFRNLGIAFEPLSLNHLYDRTAVKAGLHLARTIRERGIALLHTHDFYSNIFAGPWARLGGAKFVASRRWWNGPDRIAQRIANRISYSLADAVTVNSPSLGRFIVSNEWLDASVVHIIPNFLEPEAFAPPPDEWLATTARELALPAHRKVIGVVASLSPVKNHAMLLHASASLCRRVPELYLVFAGADAGTRGALEALSHSLGITSRVRFAGLQPNRPSYHWLFDISVLTSRSEGLPNSILEAMACRRAVISTRVGAVPDAVIHGETGLLVEPGDVRALAVGLELLLSDAVLRERLGALGHERAQQLYSEEPVISRLVALYSALVPPT